MGIDRNQFEKFCSMNFSLDARVGNFFLLIFFHSVCLTRNQTGKENVTHNVSRDYYFLFSVCSPLYGCVVKKKHMYDNSKRNNVLR